MIGGIRAKVEEFENGSFYVFVARAPAKVCGPLSPTLLLYLSFLHAINALLFYIYVIYIYFILIYYLFFTTFCFPLLSVGILWDVCAGTW